MHEGWNSKRGRWASNAPAIEKRAREARVWLRELGRRAEKEGMEDVNIVVVTHGGFLHYFTDDVCFFFFFFFFFLFGVIYRSIFQKNSNELKTNFLPNSGKIPPFSSEPAGPILNSARIISALPIPAIPMPQFKKRKKVEREGRELRDHLRMMSRGI